MQSVTKGKGLPTWMNQSDLTRLNSLADFSMHLMFNSLAKKRITAGESDHACLTSASCKVRGCS